MSVEQLLATGALPVALEALLGEWRETRSPVLGEAIEQVGARLDAARARAVAGKTVDERLARWASIAAARQPADVGELMRTLLDVPGHELEVRLRTLLAWEPDPRIAHGTITAMEQSFAKRGATWRWFHELFRIIVRHGDARVGARLAAKTSGPFRNAALSRANFWAKTAHELARVLEPFPAPNTDRDARLLSLATPAAAQPPPDADALLAAIYDAPDDDVARQVYADYLLERADPRGDFITLQLANTATKRQHELIRTYGDDWLGPLAPLAPRTGRVFARGFLHAARVEETTRDIALRALAAPEWATVVELDVLRWSTADVVLHPALRALRTLRGVPPSWMTRALPARVERVELRPGASAALAAYAPQCAWRIAHLELPAWRFDVDLDAFWRSDLVRRLETLSVTLLHNTYEPPAVVAPQIAQLARCSVPTVRIARAPARPADWALELVRERTGHRRLRIEPRGSVPDLASLGDLLFALDSDQVSRVQLVGCPPDIAAQLADRTGWRCELAG